jgi:glycerol kinase
MSLYLTIDQGGHASRALVFDARGTLVAQGYEEVVAQHPQRDWVEYDARHILHSVQRAIEKALAALGDRKRDIRSAGLATQRSTIVCWDKTTGDALSPAISWQDRRAAGWARQFERHDDAIHQATGLFVTAHYGVSKLHWCLNNLAPVRKAHQERRLLWGPLASYLLYHLSVERAHAVDPSNASRTLLWNFQTQDWDDGLLDLFGLPGDPLPQCVPTVHELGHLESGGIRVPISVMTGDQAAALYAHGEPRTSTAYVNIGTGAFVQRISGGNADYSPRLLTSVVLQKGPDVSYVLEGTINGAGSALVEIERALKMDEALAERELPRWMNESSNPPLFINGVSGLGSPYWVPSLSSRFVGDGLAEEKLVGVAESIVFLIQANLEEMESIFIAPRLIFATGGLARVDGLCQRLASLSGIPVHRPGECEATARGTAYLLAGLPVDWPEPAGAQTFEPRDDPSLRARYDRWRSEMTAAMENARLGAR